ncbi:sulfurtransferase complex subunit TusB [Biostraticola tofi]|uniref:Protein TusB n=1 Tax=Biostraticola tofi TaxID=466109 RepID=A0A4R3YRI4_9GAMM|nr:sulfurtransferase complex subunit TusB [Biostraticola tofi]TCV93623.1 tRNA 2-thiouridine synthesizing protein B [Biostraticola tofi]
MLHTLRLSPFQCSLEPLLRIVAEGDDLLLIQDGVMAGLKDCAALAQLCQTPLGLYALKNDVEARGLAAHFSDNVALVSYNEFVELTVKHRQQMAW